METLAIGTQAFTHMGHQNHVAVEVVGYEPSISGQPLYVVRNAGGRETVRAHTSLVTHTHRGQNLISVAAGCCLACNR